MASLSPWWNDLAPPAQQAQAALHGQEKRAAATARQQEQELAINYRTWTATAGARKRNEGSPPRAHPIRVFTGQAGGDAVRSSDPCFGNVMSADPAAKSAAIIHEDPRRNFDAAPHFRSCKEMHRQCFMAAVEVYVHC
ncbi:hypothetical protein [Xanthomonas bundabergensis]|uniref:hypothetical protein n=1 Tax=Xanthomonas bundabergensis TaxID=3160842 RepID=UPI003513EEFC